MYDFGEIRNISIEEIVFKKSLAHFGVSISDGNPDHKIRHIVTIPGFKMDTTGAVIPRRGTSHNEIVFPPSKENVEKQLRVLIDSSKESKDEKIVLCIDEEREEIGIAMIPNKKWYPVWSMI